MTARYVDIDVNEPLDLGVDDNHRAMFQVTVTCEKTYSEEFLQEIVKLLEDGGVGTDGTDIFWTAAATVPDGEGPFTMVRATSGLVPRRTHNEVWPPAYQRPSAAITVHAADPEISLATAYKVYNAVGGVRNTVVAST